jgi:homoserine O-succinyltransferase/O-acetyltransferase
MPLLLDTTPVGSTIALPTAEPVTIGLVNNMPDAAVEATERHFVDLLRAAAARSVVRLKLFAIADLPRGEEARAALAARYRDIGALWDGALDGLIVTGTEPRADDLRDEPYWIALTKIIDWAQDNTTSTIWSCLAAHAAVLHLDGIVRRRLPEKTFGVFACEAVAAQALTTLAAPAPRVPHSRYNDLPETALAASGYRVLSRTAAAGVDMFAKEDGASSLFLFLQGHPEYEATTLLREYRRDVARFLRGEQKSYPAMPQGYFGAAAALLANAFRARALHEPHEDLIGDFPMTGLAAGLEADWRRSAIGFYTQWIDYLKERKTARRPAPPPLRRAARSGGAARP